MDFEIDTVDPLTGQEVIVTADLYADGWVEDYTEGNHHYSEIKADPLFYNYKFENLVTGEEGDMPVAWKFGVDSILQNIYWDRKFRWVD